MNIAKFLRTLFEEHLRTVASAFTDTSFMKLTYFMSLTLFITPENIRKPLVFLRFQGVKRRVALNGLNTFAAVTL